MKLEIRVQKQDEDTQLKQISELMGLYSVSSILNVILDTFR